MIIKSLVSMLSCKDPINIMASKIAVANNKKVHHSKSVRVLNNSKFDTNEINHMVDSIFSGATSDTSRESDGVTYIRQDKIERIIRAIIVRSPIKHRKGTYPPPDKPEIVMQNSLTRKLLKKFDNKYLNCFYCK